MTFTEPATVPAFPGFRLPRLCLPRPGTDLSRWAVVACDQYTSEPGYWQRAEQVVGDAPSTLRLIFPEVFLEAGDAPARIRHIQAAMRDYQARGLFVEHDGAVLVERSVDGHTRRGLMLELDLEHYDFSPDVEQPDPPDRRHHRRAAGAAHRVRRDAELELPHILVLIDDPGCTVIEPLAAARTDLAPLYDAELMLGGGRVAGFAVGAAAGERAAQALSALARPAVFEQRYGVPRARRRCCSRWATATTRWPPPRPSGTRPGPGRARSPQPLRAGGGGEHPRPGAGTSSPSTGCCSA
jgi:hypothetical protein